MRNFPGIPEPQATIQSHQATLMVIKEAVEVLTRQRKIEQVSQSAVTWDDLVSVGLITRDQIPRR